MKTAESEIKKEQRIAAFFAIIGGAVFLFALFLTLSYWGSLWIVVAGLFFLLTFSAACTVSAFADALDFMKKEREGRL